jgi:hypothetical protein
MKLNTTVFVYRKGKSEWQSKNVVAVANSVFSEIIWKALILMIIEVV